MTHAEKTLYAEIVIQANHAARLLTFVRAGAPEASLSLLAHRIDHMGRCARSAWTCAQALEVLATLAADHLDQIRHRDVIHQRKPVVLHVR